MTTEAITEINRRLGTIELEIARLSALRASLKVTLEVMADRRWEATERAFVVDPDTLKGLSVEEAAILIAEASGGVLRSADAREAMEVAGILANPATASTTLYNALSTSERFERQAKGEYKLVPRGATGDADHAVTMTHERGCALGEALSLALGSEAHDAR